MILKVILKVKIHRDRKNGFNGTWYVKRKNAIAPLVMIIKN